MLEKIKKVDKFQLEILIRESFWNIYQEGCDEHLIVEKIFDDECFVPSLSYCYKENGIIKGAIFYALGDIKCLDGNNRKVLFFGPLGVHPKYQKQGIGSKLIKYTLKLAKNMGYPFVIITGNPNYYHRFGFESVTKYNIRYDYMLENEEHNYFMICKLNECDISKYAGIYEDPEIYAIDKEELLEFEKKFMI